MTFALNKQGYETEVARTSLEAKALWENGKYDLVILDVSLPDGSGYDLCREIRQTSKIPIMFLTAADEETNIIMGLDLGGDDYITKPFSGGGTLYETNTIKYTACFLLVYFFLEKLKVAPLLFIPCFFILLLGGKEHERN